MVRAIGIDPGTKSMDICGLEDGRVYYEKAIPTNVVAENPDEIIKAAKEAFPLDLIVGPSGYGVELTKIDNIPDEKFEDWYYNYILLTRKEEIEAALKNNVFGALVYYAMTKSALAMKKENWPVVYIPGVINLPSVPRFRKVNKMDMGTADKLCVSVLGVADQAKRLRIDYKDTDFLLVEMGFGYNAVMGISSGRIVEGIGGTIFPGIGFLTASALDFELAQLGNTWTKEDIFSGGVASITGIADETEFISKIRTDEKSKLGWEAMMDGIEKGVAEAAVSVNAPKEILFSGRLTRLPAVRKELKERLSHYGVEIRGINPLPGAKLTKETAQGYAVVAEGLAGGDFEDLVNWMGIKDAKGTALDYIYHPKIEKAKENFVEF